LHASGVLAVVLAGFAIGHNAAEAGYATRLQERQVWRSLDVLLEAFVFAYMGLQLRFVIQDVVDQGAPLGRLFAGSLLVLLVVLAIRPIWVFVVFSGRLLIRRVKVVGKPIPEPTSTWQHNALISWTGMRGVVTLAAASGVPLTTLAGDPFPGRAGIQFVAFVVAVGTLLIQGATLPTLVRRLAISTAAEEEAERVERRRAQKISRKASHDAAAALLADPPAGIDPAVLSAVADRLREAQESRATLVTSEDQVERDAEAKNLARAITLLRKRMLSAQRTALVAERDSGTLDDEVLRDLLEQLDYEQAATSIHAAARL
jgi:CPA1 family monovalent cation:H+ antiporter